MFIYEVANLLGRVSLEFQGILCFLFRQSILECNFLLKRCNSFLAHSVHRLHHSYCQYVELAVVRHLYVAMIGFHLCFQKHHSRIAIAQGKKIMSIFHSFTLTHLMISLSHLFTACVSIITTELNKQTIANLKGEKKYDFCCKF